MRLELDIRKRLGTFMLDAQIETGGGVLVLFGPSGSGKSMTLQGVAGMMRPDAGRIAVDGDVLLDTGRGIEVAPQGRRIGYVPQSYALFPHLTVAENIAFGLRRWPRKAAAAEVGRLIELLRLGGLEGQRPAQLSGGQQQRVALARALAIGPRLLLLDEPFSAIDAIVRDALREDLLRIHHELGVGVVVVSHDLADVNALADVVAVYHHGRVLQVGPRAEVFRRPATAAVARFTGARNLLAGRVVEADAAGCRVAIGEVQIRTASAATRVGDGVIVVIRPESARLLADGEQPLQDEQILPAVVCRAIPQGRGYAVEVALGGHGGPTMEVVVPVWWWEQRTLAPPMACRIGVGSSAVHLLPAQLAEELEESTPGFAGVV